MLKSKGIVTEIYEYPNALHSFTYKSSIDSTDAQEKMASFLRKYLN